MQDNTKIKSVESDLDYLLRTGESLRETDKVVTSDKHLSGGSTDRGQNGSG